VIIIFALEGSLHGMSQLLAGAAGGGDETDVRDFQLAAIVDAQALRFFVPIFDDAEADVIVRAEPLLVVEHCHGIGPHDSAGGGFFHHGRLRNGGHGTGLLRLERQGAREAGSEEEGGGPGSHAVSIFSLLEAIGAIKRDAILPVIAQRLI
jgi:hypothetical protein